MKRINFNRIREISHCFWEKFQSSFQNFHIQNGPTIFQTKMGLLLEKKLMFSHIIRGRSIIKSTPMGEVSSSSCSMLVDSKDLGPLAEKKQQLENAKKVAMDLLMNYPVLNGTAEPPLSCTLDDCLNLKGESIRQFLATKKATLLGQGTFGSAVLVDDIVLKIPLGKGKICIKASAEQEKSASEIIQRGLRTIRAVQREIDQIDHQLKNLSSVSEEYKVQRERKVVLRRQLTSRGGVALGPQSQNIAETYGSVGTILVQPFIPGESTVAHTPETILDMGIQLSSGMSGLYRMNLWYNDMNMRNALHRSVFTDASGEVVAMGHWRCEKSIFEVSDLAGEVLGVYGEVAGNLYTTSGELYAKRDANGHWNKRSPKIDPKAERLWSLLTDKTVTLGVKTTIIDFGLVSEGMQRKGLGTPIYGGMLNLPCKDVFAVLVSMLMHLNVGNGHLSISKEKARDIQNLMDMWQKMIDHYLAESKKRDQIYNDLACIIYFLLATVFPDCRRFPTAIPGLSGNSLTSEQLIEVLTIVKSAIHPTSDGKNAIHIPEEYRLVGCTREQQLQIWITEVVREVRRVYPKEFPRKFIKEFCKALQRKDTDALQNYIDEMSFIVNQDETYKESLLYGLYVLKISLKPLHEHQAKEWMMAYPRSALKLFFHSKYLLSRDQIKKKEGSLCLKRSECRFFLMKLKEILCDETSSAALKQRLFADGKNIAKIDLFLKKVQELVKF